MTALAPVRTVAPAKKLLSIAEAKDHCRVDEGDDDTLIGNLISAATAHLDGYSGVLGRALITQTWRQDFDDFTDCMRLPLAPLGSTVSVTYLDTADSQQTLATSVYEIVTDHFGPFVGLKSGQAWPSTSDLRAAVSITFECGYGADAADVPQALRQAALLLISHWYENREAVTEGNMSMVPMAVDSLIAPYRRVLS